MYLLWWVYYSSPKRVTDLFGRVCICCGGCTSGMTLAYYPLVGRAAIASDYLVEVPGSIPTAVNFFINDDAHQRP